MKNKNGHEPLRLNIGSGDTLTMKGYVNVDAKFGDTAYPLKYPDNSVDECRASHILEHFSQGQTLDVVKDWVRTLKPGGVLKIAVPDFKWIAEAYLKGAHAQGMPLASYLMGGQTDENDYHKAIFDEPTLRQILTNAGLIDIQPWQSEVKDCASLAVSLNLMGRKPNAVVANGHASLYSVDGLPINIHFEAFTNSLDPKNFYSQFGEDGIIRAIFDRIGTANKWCVECGAGDGLFFSNTRKLIEEGWKSLQIEADEKVYQTLYRRYEDDHNVIPVNSYIGLTKGMRLDDVLAGYNAFSAADGLLPADFDLLVLDIDGQEYHIVNSLEKFKPRVLIVEYNPAADPMYIPEADAPPKVPWELDQAGRLALKFACEARGYDVICRTPVNLVCVRRDLSHLLMEETVSNDTALGAQEKRFVAGEWRAETEVIKDHVAVNVAIAMSSPRIGYLDSADIITEIALAVRARRGRGFGVYFHHSLSRCIKQALDDEDADVDIIVTADYDTFARPADLVEMIKLLYENPSIDAVIPVEIKREQFADILVGSDGPVDWTKALSPANTGHFGLTVFRRRVFERMKKPWFWERPDENGDWGEGRVDADIGFWHNFNDSGLKAALATRVVIGHREEVVSVPKIEDGNVKKVYLPISEWLRIREEEALARLR